jgi:hypothetical protein
MRIFIVMEMVDLGGHAVEAYTDKTKAIEVVDSLNERAKNSEVESLMKNCSYTEEQANAWVSSYWPYDLYESTLIN